MSAAEQAAKLREDLEMLRSMQAEAEYEYTSKKRLQVIAVAALGTLLVQYEAGAAALEAAAQQESSLIVPV